MGWKDWVYGDLVSAADFQSLVQDQTVQRYADSAARTSALGSAVAEGMVSYLDSTDTVEVYTGSSWTSISSAGSGNALINGAFEINQRGFSSSTTNGVYTFDRWKTNYSGGTVTYSSQAFTPGAAPVAGYEGTNFARIAVSGQSTSTQYASINQWVEDVRSFAGQTVTVSFFAKASSGTPKVSTYTGQQFGSGGSSAVYTYGTAVTISTSWARYSITFAVPSISGKTVGGGSAIELGISASDGYNANLGFQNATIDLWGVQLEAGSSATAFKRNAPSLQGELAACQRYYWQAMTGLNKPLCAAFNYSNSQVEAIIQFPVEMRTTPSIVQTTGTNYYNFLRSSANDQFNSLTIDQVSPIMVAVYNNTEISGTAGQAGFISGGNAASSFALSAEL